MTATRVRIKKGVRPFGGRTVVVSGTFTYPNGREVVRVFAPTSSQPDAAGVVTWPAMDIREYAPDEVEPVAMKGAPVNNDPSVRSLVALLIREALSYADNLPTTEAQWVRIADRLGRARQLAQDAADAAKKT